MADLRSELINQIVKEYSLDGLRLLRVKDLTEAEKFVLENVENFRALLVATGDWIGPGIPFTDFGRVDRLGGLVDKVLNAALRIGATVERGYSPSDKEMKTFQEFYEEYLAGPTLFEPAGRPGPDGDQLRGETLEPMAALVLLGLSPSAAAGRLAEVEARTRDSSEDDPLDSIKRRFERY